MASMDFLASLSLVAMIVSLGGVFAVLRAQRAIAFARIQRDGGSVLLDEGAMNAAYWALQPLGRLCVRIGISADAITVGSLGLAFAAGVLLAFGHFGLAALVTVAASLGDALDGLVARESKTASASGEVLDAAADRYAELFFLGGLAVHYRFVTWALVLTLAATVGSYMVSYATAKAEALGVEAPRGAMRRPERATYLALGAALVPLTAKVLAGHPWWAAEAPMLAALALVASVGNVSAVRRLGVVARAVAQPAAIVATARRHDLVATLGRHQIGSIIATLVDFGTMTALVEAGLATPVLATLAGASLGGVTNFSLGRAWIFRTSSDAALPQAMRYALVSAVSAGLNTFGEHVAHDRLGVQYVLARVVVAITVSLLWNFPLQRHFVFPKPAESPAPHGREASSEP